MEGKMSKQFTASDNYYLSTGIKELNQILEMDMSSTEIEEGNGGFKIGKKPDKVNKLEPPIILLNGGTGTGKTTLMLQIAFSAAKGNIWVPCFCSLEQTARSLETVSNSFKKFTEIDNSSRVSTERKRTSQNPNDEVSFCDLANVKNMPVKFRKEDNKIYLCHLSPRPISENEDSNIFQVRLDQLNHILKEIKAVDGFPVFFLDSINAFAINPLTRNEIYRLFSLFRNHHIPAVISMEHHIENYSEQALDCLQNAKFLSDIIISLSKDNSGDYLKYYLEIEKSRVSRQALGKHIYKIRDETVARKVQYDTRTGIVLYPSIHPVLSKAREQKPLIPETFYVCKGDPDLGQVTSKHEIDTGACFSIIGPAGTHKLALGMNLAMGYKEGKSPSLLIINFGGSAEYKFKYVAWTTSRAPCRFLNMLDTNKDNEKQNNNGIPPWKKEYRLDNEENKDPLSKGYSPHVTLLPVKFGSITPEECYFMFTKAIDIAKENGTPYSSVLLSDTAELCNGFPLLASDPLFLPALIDLFAAKNLATICIGVDEGSSAKNRDINFSLSSRADYRIVLSHYPDVKELSKKIVRSHGQGIREQYVSLIIDNVTGKHYERKPRWLYVKEKNEVKTLHCTEFPPNDNRKEILEKRKNDWLDNLKKRQHPLHRLHKFEYKSN
jgi:KaiC/GvpD/RAD55 family RecA-like ATPase